MNEQYKMVAENAESTVVSEFEPGYRSAAQYQSEAEMEADFIKMLQRQAYEYLPIKSEADLIRNLRRQLEKLNSIKFTDEEWQEFFTCYLGNPNEGIVEKTSTVQEDYRKVLQRADGSMVNVVLIDKEHIHNNSLQVINQYVPEGGAHENRYDVTILVNGLPLVHVELKRRGVAIKEAFNQIRRYNRESFWAGCGLFEFVQIFIISNGTLTKYYSNTTRDAHIREQNKQGGHTGRKQTSNSFEFTSFWAANDNTPIYDLVDFTQTFLSKHTLLNVLTKYCVFTSEKLLLVMRPYQIAATEAIIQRIKSSSNYKNWGKREGGGYIWHTTGSGKTLTSFKTARLASLMPEIDKVLFVVDRKDLDYQTMKEYDRFEKGAANSNTSTAVLARQLGDPNARIIITTIQKLTNFIAQNAQHDVYTQHVVLIFDECHRSQFGDMHKAITKKFKKYHMFGFTGTPIFPENAGAARNVEFTTTEGAFGERLHCYTIVDAIRDGNVLPFKVDYISTMHEQEQITDEQVPSIDRERALAAPQRIIQVSKYILDHFVQKTKRDVGGYSFSRLTNIAEVATARNRNGVQEVKEKTTLRGFNSILAVQSIPFAKLYYQELKKQMEALPSDKRLKIATIYSYAANEEVEDGSGLPDDEDNESTEKLDKSSRDFLELAIEDYNKMFGTSYDTSSERFQNYYKDLSMRMKNREVDLLIVVNMFLTGFDATTLNTLWVDKNLKMHGLLQAYSRTNRILNSIKTFGNIVCFRNLEPATNACLQLFGNKDAGGLILLKPFKDYYEGYTDDKGESHIGYQTLIRDLLQNFPLGRVIMGEQAEKRFISLFGNILRALNILTTFDEFLGQEIITEEQLLDYKSIYLNLHDKYRSRNQGEAVIVNDDIVFEMELVKSVEINIDYILFLVGQLTGDKDKDREVVLKVRKSVNSSPDLRDKAELIDSFIDQYTPKDDVNDEWNRFVKEHQQIELNQIIEGEHLKKEETHKFVAQAFRDAGVKETGTAIADILPPMSPFDVNRAEKKDKVLDLLKKFFTKFYDISGGVLYEA